MRVITNLAMTVGMISSAVLFTPGCGDGKSGGLAHDGAAGSGSDAGVLSDAGCGTFVACGGSVVGTWKMSPTESCLPSTPTLANCPGYAVSGSYQTGYTITFGSSGTTTNLFTVTGTEQIRYPMGCATGSGCPSITVSEDGGVSETCAENPPGECYCNIDYGNFTQTTQGSYTTSGSTITGMDTGSGSTPDTADYCVQGNTLKLHFIDPSAGAVTLVYTRQ